MGLPRHIRKRLEARLFQVDPNLSLTTPFPVTMIIEAAEHISIHHDLTRTRTLTMKNLPKTALMILTLKMNLPTMREDPLERRRGRRRYHSRRNRHPRTRRSRTKLHQRLFLLQPYLATRQTKWLNSSTDSESSVSTIQHICRFISRSPHMCRT